LTKNIGLLLTCTYNQGSHAPVCVGT